MPLLKQDKEYNLSLISLVDAKTIDLERVLTNFLIRLRYDGAPTTRSRAKLIRVQDVVDAACGHDLETHLIGFATHKPVVYRWFESDLLDLVNRGNPLKENLASARPLHLTAFRLRNPKFCQDYGASDALYNLLHWEAQDVLGEIRAFFGEGLDAYTDRYDETTELDIETTVLVRLADSAPNDQRDPKKQRPQPMPLCLIQARILADDLRRLLAYKGQVPRAVMIGYLKNIMGLHIGLYTLRLFRILPELIEREKHPSTCVRCHNSGGRAEPCEDCPLRPAIVADMGDSHRTRMAELARQSVQEQIGAMSRYVKAHIAFKKLHEYATHLMSRGKLTERPATVLDLVKGRAYPDPESFNAYFDQRIDNLVSTEDGTEPDARLIDIQRMGLPAFDTYVEMLFLLRQGYHSKHYIGLLDSALQKNQEAGLMRQGRGSINLRRFAIGSQMLETLVQIAVLRPATRTGFTSEPILIDEFFNFLRKRYGIYVDALPGEVLSAPDDLAAVRSNVAEFKRRLRELGFYTDLSDAYITQTIRPRFTVEATA